MSVDSRRTELSSTAALATRGRRGAAPGDRAARRSSTRGALPLLVGRSATRTGASARRRRSRRAPFASRARRSDRRWSSSLGAGDNVGLRNAAVEVLAAAGAAAATPALARRSRVARRRRAQARRRGARASPRPGARSTAARARARRRRRRTCARPRSRRSRSSARVAPERVDASCSSRSTTRIGWSRLTALEGLTALDVPVPWARLAPLLDDAMLRPVALSAAALTRLARGGARARARARRDPRAARSRRP